VNTWRVLAWNPVQCTWTVRSSHTDPDDAAEHAEALAHRDTRLRVRVSPALPRWPLTVSPPVNNAARDWRLNQAGAMSDRADTNKRYKSPG
jgi:hypothetical protein